MATSSIRAPFAVKAEPLLKAIEDSMKAVKELDKKTYKQAKVRKMSEKEIKRIFEAN